MQNEPAIREVSSCVGCPALGILEDENPIPACTLGAELDGVPDSPPDDCPLRMAPVLLRLTV